MVAMEKVCSLLGPISAMAQQKSDDGDETHLAGTPLTSTPAGLTACDSMQPKSILKESDATDASSMQVEVSDGTAEAKDEELNSDEGQEQTCKFSVFQARVPENKIPAVPIFEDDHPQVSSFSVTSTGTADITRPVVANSRSLSVPSAGIADISRPVVANNPNHVNCAAKCYKRPQNFDGSGSLSWTSYLCHFNLIANYNHWDEALAGAELSTCMLGQALNVLCELPLSKRQCYKAIVDLFNRFYNPEGREVGYRASSHSRKIKYNETPMEFGAALKELAAKAYPNLGMIGRDDVLKSQFLSGLDNLEMCKHISMQQPQSLDAAIALATLYQSVESSQKAGKTGAAKPHVALVNSKAEPDVFAEINRKLDIIIDALVKKENTNRIPRTPCPRCRQRGHWARDCPGEGQENRSCYGCGQKGHLRNRCPNRNSPPSNNPEGLNEDRRN